MHFKRTDILVVITCRIPAGTTSLRWAAVRCVVEVNACQGQSGAEKSLQHHSVLLTGIFKNKCEGDLNLSIPAALQG